LRGVRKAKTENESDCMPWGRTPWRFATLAKIHTSINEPSPGLTANHRYCRTISLLSPSPHQNPRLLPRLASCRTEYLAPCVRSITHCSSHLHLNVKIRYRANVNINKHAATLQRVMRNASALFTTALRCKVLLLCALSHSAVRLLQLPPLRLWTCLHSILPQAC